MKKLLLLLSVASLANAMEQEVDPNASKSMVQAPAQITMVDRLKNRNYRQDAQYLMENASRFASAAKENAEYVADCGCLAPSIDGYLQRNPNSETLDYVTSCCGMTDADPRLVTFGAGVAEGMSCCCLPAWAGIAKDLGAMAGYKLVERKFNKMKELRKQKAE